MVLLISSVRAFLLGIVGDIVEVISKIPGTLVGYNRNSASILLALVSLLVTMKTLECAYYSGGQPGAAKFDQNLGTATNHWGDQKQY